MTTQWTGPEDPAETARWEEEKRADAGPTGCPVACVAGCHEDHLPQWRRERCFRCDLVQQMRAAQRPEPALTDTSWLRMEPHRPPMLASVRRVLSSHTSRTSYLAIGLTAFVSGALAALGVLAVAAGWHGLGAR